MNTIDPDDRTLLLLVLGNIAWAKNDYTQATRLIEESLHLSQTINDLWLHTLALHAFGKVRWSQGDDAQAQSLFEASLVEARELGDKRGIAQCLEGLATVAASQGWARRAAQLFAVAEALRDAIGAPRPPVERASYAHSMAAAHAQLGEAEFAVAWAEGQARRFESVMAEILAQPPAPQ